ncbi:MAG: hypothetical protein L6R38_005450 [Xanthoria sp. 2 TBL-2021]|nr:MAG: hypothetical protein L6R38_005450 [Xanthoria sp. 2 TBL-2021]
MEAYADTPKEVLETIDYLDQLKHQTVQPANDGNECSICLEPFSSSGQGGANDSSGLAETPVSLPCGHIIGFKLEKSVANEIASNSPMCRRKLFEAPYKPDTVTKLRARLQAFDNYFQQHPENARPDRTNRLRDLLWQFSRTTKVVPEELPRAKVEAQAAIINLNSFTATRGSLQDFTSPAAEPRHLQLREHMIRLRQQAQSVAREQERAQNEAREREAAAQERVRERARLVGEDYQNQDGQRARAWQQPQAATRIDLSAQGDQRGQRYEHLLDEARQPPRLTRECYEPSDYEDSDEQVGRSARGSRHPPPFARNRVLNRGAQREQRHEQLSNETRQQAQSIGEDSEEDSEHDYAVQDYDFARGWQHPRRSSRIRRLSQGVQRGQRPEQLPNEARQQARGAQNGLDQRWERLMVQARPRQVSTTTPTETQQTGGTQRELPGSHFHSLTYAGNRQRDAAQTTTQPDQPNAREQRLNALERSLDEREEALERQHQALEERERDIAQRERIADARDELHRLRGQDRTYNGLAYFENI